MRRNLERIELCFRWQCFLFLLFFELVEPPVFEGAEAPPSEPQARHSCLSMTLPHAVSAPDIRKWMRMQMGHLTDRAKRNSWESTNVCEWNVHGQENHP